MELIEPSVVYRDSYIEAVREFQADHSFPLMERTWDALSIPELQEHFDTYVAAECAKAQGEGLPEGWVPVSTYWLVDGGAYIGSINIRHQLNERLERIGGHIGYSIRPSRRGYGYGSAILALGKERARALGITRILLTCDATNTASRKIIEKNRGVFENEVPNPETGVDKLRFWIENG
jgi:predicted acetyltransferase